MSRSSYKKNPFRFLCRASAFFVMITGTGYGCGFNRELPVHLAKTEQRMDSLGRVRYKKFDQVIEDENGRRSVATIVQEFDSIGRPVKEYGSDHARLGKQYLFDIHYMEKARVVNFYKWATADTAAFTKNLQPAFTEQKILIDTADFLKIIIITKVAADRFYFVGRYLENFPVTNKTYANESRPFVVTYLFKLPMATLLFDEDKMLNLGGKIIIDQY